MPESIALTRVTARPAEVLGLAREVGALTPGACADLAVLRWNEDAFPLRDTDGIERPGGCWEPIVTVRAGKIIRPIKL
jgi:imidazolonepropionase-like amidohydrolase